MTATPIGWRERRRRCDIATGIMPATIATVVMTIGRARLWPASGSRSVLAGAHLLDREVDQQDRVLGDDSHEHQEADQRRATPAGR